MCCNCQTNLKKHELSTRINDEGGWEEFHQKRGNHYMFDFHKNNRKKLEKQYREDYSIGKNIREKRPNT